MTHAHLETKSLQFKFMDQVISSHSCIFDVYINLGVRHLLSTKILAFSHIVVFPQFVFHKIFGV